jgi:tRNA-Thr(GGU) m(6)t(6)A37 methyltransferase TsaA
MSEPFSVHAIGLVRTPYIERREAPRQPRAAAGALGRIELFRGHNFEHALEDLQGFSHLWLIFLFDRNSGWRPKVLPPRSRRRRGVFSTRSPHRPNPIGLSLVELERVDGLTLHVRNVDMLDGSPLLDIKPYVPYADYAPNALTGWLAPLVQDGPSSLAADPEPGFEVSFAALAARQLGFLLDRFGIDLRPSIVRVLELGPQPHPYRRIKRLPNGLRLAVKDWRADFEVTGRQVTVTRVTSGYRQKQLSTSEDATLSAHRAFVAEFDEPLA